MRTFGQLTRAERTKAINKALEQLVDCAATGLISFGKNLQGKIDLAIKQADDNNMQWSRQEYVMEAAKPELLVLAKGIAEDAKYSTSGDFVKEEEL